MREDHAATMSAHLTILERRVRCYQRLILALGLVLVIGISLGAVTMPSVADVLQARRFDPTGEYVRRYVEELEDVALPDVLEPWKSGDVKGYPAPLVDHAEAAARFRRRRAR